MASQTASNRSFGFLIAAVLAIVGGLTYWSGSGHPSWVWAAAIFLAIAVLMPRLLLPLKRLWLKFGYAIHVVMGPVMLGLLYLMSIVLVGLPMRLFGKDPLSLKRDPAASSYWIRRTPPGPDPKSLRNQF